MDSIKIVCDTLCVKTCKDDVAAPVANVGVIQVLCCLFIAISIVILLGVLVNLISKRKIGNKWLASKRVFSQVMGAAIDIKWKWFFFLFILLAIVVGVSLIISPGCRVDCLRGCALTFMTWLVFKICHTLTDIFILRKEEGKITWCQVFFLLAIGFWIIGFLIIYDTKDKPQITAAVGVVGALLGWIFQDKVKGVATFFHLRLHHLLKIGDWIKVPSLNVDGEVKRVSLTTVTIYNWDTTTSVIPISALSSGHFNNLEKMTEGKTYGRRMLRSYVFDTSWFQPLKSDDVEKIIQKHPEVKDYLPSEEIKDVVLNAHLYRIYLYHWLMRQPYISQQPRLMVRWEEQVDTGMPLQVYAYITEGSVAPFERKQSLITEHIIESMKWFELKLYQSPSAYDASNSNIFMADKPATYREEDEL